MVLFVFHMRFACVILTGQLKEYIDDTEDFINIKLVRTPDIINSYLFYLFFPQLEYLMFIPSPFFFFFLEYECQDNIQNQLIQFGLLLSGATFVVTAFAVVTAVFGMNFADPVFDLPSNFDSALITTGFCCGSIYLFFLLYVKHRKLLHL